MICAEGFRYGNMAQGSRTEVNDKESRMTTTVVNEELVRLSVEGSVQMIHREEANIRFDGSDVIVNGETVGEAIPSAAIAEGEVVSEGVPAVVEFATAQD